VTPIEAAELGKLDHVDATLAQLAFRDVRRIGVLNRVLTTLDS